MIDQNKHIRLRHDNETKEYWYIEVLNASLKGKNVQYRYAKSDWRTIEENHSWDFKCNDYRIVAPRRYIMLMKDNNEVDIVSTYDCIEELTNIPSNLKYFIMEEVPR